MLLFSNLKIFGHTDARVTTLRAWTCFQDYTVSWACILRESDSHYTTLGYFFLFFYRWDEFKDARRVIHMYTESC